MPNRMLDWALGIVTTLAMALASWSLKWTFDANARLAVIQQQINSVNTARDDAQDKRMDGFATTSRMFWRDRTWVHGQINKVRVQQGMGVADEPDLGS